MNKNQKIVLAIFIPIIFFFIGLFLKNDFAWLLASIFCCIFEYKLFADKKDKQ